jgi:hypothetical protein
MQTPALPNNASRMHMFPASHARFPETEVPGKSCSRDRGPLTCKKQKHIASTRPIAGAWHSACARRIKLRCCGWLRCGIGRRRKPRSEQKRTAGIDGEIANAASLRRSSGRKKESPGARQATGAFQTATDGDRHCLSPAVVWNTLNITCAFGARTYMRPMPPRMTAPSKMHLTVS